MFTETFIEMVYEFAGNDDVIVGFSNFCFWLIRRIGCKGHSFNIKQMATKVIEYLKENDAEDSRKYVFIRHCVNNRETAQPLFACYKNKDNFLDIHEKIFACLFKVHNTIRLSRHEQVCFLGCVSRYTSPIIEPEVSLKT